MTTEFKHIPDCITASTLTPFITESFKYEDNTELSTVFDWLYNCIKSKPNMSVEAAISLMDAFNRGIRIALRTGIDEEPDFSKIPASLARSTSSPSLDTPSPYIISTTQFLKSILQNIQ